MTPLQPGQIEILTVRPIGAAQVACQVRTPEKTGLTYFGSVHDDIQNGDIREALPFCKVGKLIRRDTMGQIDPAMVSVVDTNDPKPEDYPHTMDF